MADDRMRNKEEVDRNMGGAGQKHQDKYGQKSPGRGEQDDDFTSGRRGAGQRGEQDHIKDDFGTSGSNMGHGGQNRQNK